jgi:hypothetical protein
LTISQHRLSRKEVHRILPLRPPKTRITFHRGGGAVAHTTAHYIPRTRKPNTIRTMAKPTVYCRTKVEKSRSYRPTWRGAGRGNHVSIATIHCPPHLPFYRIFFRHLPIGAIISVVQPVRASSAILELYLFSRPEHHSGAGWGSSFDTIVSFSSLLHRRYGDELSKASE